MRAGARLREAVTNMAAGSHLLMLVSGGASALVEDPVEGLDLEGLRAQHDAHCGDRGMPRVGVDDEDVVGSVTNGLVKGGPPGQPA